MISSLCKRIVSLYFLAILITQPLFAQVKDGNIAVPLGGNSWVTVQAEKGKEKVTNEGWSNWENKETVFSIYIFIAKPGILKLSAKFDVPKGESKIQCSIKEIKKIFTVTGSGEEVAIGEWNIKEAGYVKINMQGVSREADVFASVSNLLIRGSAVDEQTVFVKNNDGNYFYWGRRGPSVHLNYNTSEVQDDVEWFYNEITVPIGNDVIGSYFMANGFAEGYFGMQVNSKNERRVLFSVWSPFNTDNPKEIPDDKKIILLKKGKEVTAGEFGNEGAGGQSYLKYNWKAGQAYKFLLKATPVANNYTTYSAYFYDIENKSWMLIASFNRPHTQTYLKRLHSFLENFNPATGNIERKAYYHNQWVRTKNGEWKPLSKMFVTADATAGKRFRLDYDGGIENNKFYMRNDGFFNESGILKKELSIIPSSVKPLKDSELPVE